jgi:hypothetical protein
MANTKLLTLAAMGGSMTTALELVSTRMLAPFFGTGLQVWALVLAAVLAGFAGGYFMGAWLVGRGKADNAPTRGRTIGLLLTAASAYILLGGIFCESLMAFTFRLWHHHAIIPMSIILATPSVTLLAAVTPCLVRNTDAAEGKAGTSTGAVYGISTIGGVLGIFLFGFWLLPAVGVFLALTAIIVVCALLAILAFWEPHVHGKWRIGAVGIVLGVTVFAIIRPNWLPDHVIQKYSGMMGELIVTDLPLEPEYGGGARLMLLNNRIAQTAVQPGTGISLWDYTHYVSALASLKPEGSRVLLLGMAGGSLANEFAALRLQVDAVDIDPRLPEIARKYFHLAPKVNVIIDDARHYLNVCDQDYDLIVFDLFAGEGQPSHVFSQESFARAKEHLRPEGMLMVNYHGYWDGEDGLGTRSVAATMASLGFSMYLVSTPGEPVERNLILLAGLMPLQVQTPYYRPNACCVARLPHGANLIHPLAPSAYQDGIILTDDRPLLDHLNQNAYRAWREYAIEHYLLALRADGLHFF